MIWLGLAGLIGLGALLICHVERLAGQNLQNDGAPYRYQNQRRLSTTLMTSTLC